MAQSDTTHGRLRTADAAALSNVAAITFILLVGLYISARLLELLAPFRLQLTGDEIFSLLAARKRWDELIGYVVKDIAHPPLYYLLLKAWIAVGGESLIWLRLLSIAVSTAALLPLFLLCRELGLRAAELNLALLFMAVNGFLILRAQEVRMYSLLLLLTLCSLWLFVRFLNSAASIRRVSWMLFVANALLIYTQYYGWLVVAVEFLIVALWARRKLLPAAVQLVGLILCFSPWAYAVAQVAAREGVDVNLGWTQRPDLSSLTGFYAALNGPIDIPFWGTFLRLLLFGTPVLLWALAVLRHPGKQGAGGVALFRYLLLLSLLPILFSFLVSHLFIHSIWGDRHFVIIAAPYMIFLAVAVLRLQPSWMRSVMTILIIAWVTAEFVGRNRPGDVHDWDIAAGQIIRAVPAQGPDVKVYALDAVTAYHLWFHLDSAKQKNIRVVWASANGNMSNVHFYIKELFPNVAVENLAALGEEHFWVAYREDWCADDWCVPDRPPEMILAADGHQVGKSVRLGPAGRRAILFPVWKRRFDQLSSTRSLGRFN